MKRQRYNAKGSQVNRPVNAPAVLRKWPSLNNQRRTKGTGPYLLLDGTLDESVTEFMAKSESDSTAAAAGHRNPVFRARC